MKSFLVLVAVTYLLINWTTAAPAAEIVCHYNGVDHVVGDSFQSTDGCNQCGCGRGGFVFCTEMACIKNFCSYGGMKYVDGQGFKSADGCNSCGCSNGMVVCTQRFCQHLDINS
ncbi:hypothetical protein SNE40_012542 [Patella caerulea]|uniref:Pacifastin domain-containing protein n=1 Tax=Patella caerulea TaxID=87958 RepID=A0AAN8PQQ8_PATCE